MSRGLWNEAAMRGNGSTRCTFDHRSMNVRARLPGWVNACGRAYVKSTAAVFRGRDRKRDVAIRRRR